jgi:hypothetical protein
VAGVGAAGVHDDDVSALHRLRHAPQRRAAEKNSPV